MRRSVPPPTTRRSSTTSSTSGWPTAGSPPARSRPPHGICTGRERALGSGSAEDPGGKPVLGFIALLLVVWIALIVIGAVVHGLIWLIVLGVVLFLATSVIGFLRGRSR